MFTYPEHILQRENLDQSWARILMTVCTQVIQLIKLEAQQREIWDIRNCVKFKKLPGSYTCGAQIIPGVVFSKNIIHSEMTTAAENPKMLLLECAIIYQREKRYISLDNLKLQVIFQNLSLSFV